MGTIKAGSLSAFLRGDGGAAALFGGLFKDSAGVSVEISWGDIPAGACDVHLSVRLHKESATAGVCCSHEDEGTEVNMGFCDDGVLNNMPVTDYDGDGIDDGFSDGKMRAWAEYLGDADDSDSEESEDVDLEDDPNAYMPEIMLEDDDLIDDDDFCVDEEDT